MNNCDRCGAAGKSRFILESGELIFCGHHTREYEDSLLEQNATFDVDFATYSDPALATV